ncbi:MAG: hypothetical protein JNJ91_05205 [Flavobacteriales bacterium]|nr:hypothetical protein [Flavobacteriales bacterium]
MINRNGTYLIERHELVNDACLGQAAYENAVKAGLITIAQKAKGSAAELVDWASLPEAIKAMAIAHLGGTPEQVVAVQMVERWLVLDPKDEAHLNDFRSGNGMGLSTESRAELLLASRIMAMLATVDAVTKEGGSAAVQMHYGMSVMALKALVLEYIKLNKAKLPSKFPTSFARLEARKRAYLKARTSGEAGASSLIHGGHGNANRAKVADDDQRKVLRLLAARPQNYPLRTIASDYNAIAATRGWQTISANTVKAFLSDGANGRAAAVYAKGSAQYHNTYGVVVHRSRPSQPTYLWVHDATDYELLFQREVGGKRTYHHRKKVAVVLDPHSWYPVGYAIGEEDTIELSKQAVANAVRHMREITGTYALPYQVQSDRLGHKALGEWYDSMGVKYTPAAARNARAKVIEPWFKQHNDHYVNRNFNWSGHNVTSRKENQPNPDALNLHRKDFPNEASVIEQIHEAIGRERADKVQAFQAALKAMPAGSLRTIDRPVFLERFGSVHPWTNELTNAGLCPTLLGEARPYQLLTREFQRHIGTSFQVYFDPADLSDVLATANEGSLRYLVPAVQHVPMALMDHTPDTHAHLASIEAFKRDLSQEAINQVLDDREQVQQLAEMLLADALAHTRRKPNRTTDDLITMAPEEEAVTKGYFTEKGSHKAALDTARTEAQQRKDIERWAEENF